MNTSDIAFQLTLKAIENGMINTKSTNLSESNDPIEDVNRYNAKQLSGFYEEVLKHLNSIIS